MDILFTLLLVYLGWQLHSFYVTWKVMKIVKKLSDRRPVFKDEDGVIETVAEHIQVNVVQEQGIYLVYDEDKNFICQGPSLGEVAKTFKDRTNNGLGEFRMDDKINCFFNGEHYDHNNINKTITTS
jgi:hypothetical protein